MKEIKESHTGSHLKSLMSDVMDTYHLSLDNIFSATTDNGANMIKCVSLMRDELESQSADPYGINETIEQVVGDEDYDDQIEFTIEDSPSDSIEENPVILRGVRCAAHTLQLAIEEVLDCSDQNGPCPKQIISKARAISVHLNVPTVRYVLRAQNLKMPILDVPTR